MKILIIEDDQNIREGLIETLAHEGYELISAPNGVEGIRLYKEEKPDFILLDVMMPEMDGFSVCRAIRKTDEAIPIVFLSAKDAEIDRVVGLELGADDYISKPFGVHEIRARIRAIAKRCLQQKSPQNVSHEFAFGDLSVFPDALCATRGESKISLSLREMKIIECLYAHKNQAVSRDTLFNEVWGYEHLPNSRTLDQHILRLRKNIEIDPENPQIIRTVHGVGYRFQE